jgi:hypothetical protein
MRFTYATPPAFPNADLPPQGDDAVVRKAHDLLLEVVSRSPVLVMIDRDSRGQVFAAPMATLCAEARLRQLPIERLIIAIKQAWATLPELRTQLGDDAAEVLSSAISVCIEQYFSRSEQLRRR